MKFERNEQQETLYNHIVEVAREKLNINTIIDDRENQFNRKNWQICGELGLCGLIIPPEYGGQGVDLLTAVIALEALGYGCKDNGLGLAIGAHLWGCLPLLLNYGNELQKQHLLELATGQKIVALAISEPEAGSDITSLQTTAQKVRGGYCLNGHKIYITNAPVADFLIVIAKTNPEQKMFNLSAFLIGRETKGITLSKSKEKMGMRSAAMGEIILEDCFVSQDYRIGSEGSGFSLFMNAMEWERAFILAPAIGSMQRLWETSVDYAQKRKQFGQPIAQFGQIRSKLVEMYRRTEMARLLLHQTATLKTQGKNIMLEAAMTKLTISEAWLLNCQDAMTIHGTYGYLSENEIERELRDAYASQIYSGTSEIQREMMAKLLKINQ